MNYHSGKYKLSNMMSEEPLRRVYIDEWSINEKLYLVVAVERFGDQDWLKISQQLQPLLDTIRPPDWFSPENCEIQYCVLVQQYHSKNLEEIIPETEVASDSVSESSNNELNNEKRNLMNTIRNELIESLCKEITSNKERLIEEFVEVSASDLEKSSTSTEAVVEQTSPTFLKSSNEILSFQEFIMSGSSIHLFNTMVKHHIPTIPLVASITDFEQAPSFRNLTNSAESQPLSSVYQQLTIPSTSSILKSVLKSADLSNNLKEIDIINKKEANSIVKTVLPNDNVKNKSKNDKKHFKAFNSYRKRNAQITSRYSKNNNKINHQKKHSRNKLVNPNEDSALFKVNIKYIEQKFKKIKLNDEEVNSKVKNKLNAKKIISKKQKIRKSNVKSVCEKNSCNKVTQLTNISDTPTTSFGTSGTFNTSTIKASDSVTRVSASNVSILKVCDRDTSTCKPNSILKIPRTRTPDTSIIKASDSGTSATKLHISEDLSVPFSTSKNSTVKCPNSVTIIKLRNIPRTPTIISGSNLTCSNSTVTKLFSKSESPSSSSGISYSSSTKTKKLPDSVTDTFSNENEYRLWKKTVMFIYKHLAAHKSASLFHKCRHTPEYLDLVHFPMDLQTIRKNIERGIIRTTAHFKRDVLIMCLNEIMYNKSNEMAYYMAVIFYEEALQLFEFLEETEKETSDVFVRETRSSARKRKETKLLNNGDKKRRLD